MIKTAISKSFKHMRIATTSLVGSILTGTAKYVGACSFNGKVYFSPWNGANQILEYNLSTGLTRNVGSVYAGAKKWMGCTVHSNGKVYFGLGEATQCLVYDPVTEVTALIGNTLYTGGDKFAGIIESPVNNKLYLTPSLSTRILELDPITGDTRYVGSTYASGVYKWGGNGIVDGNHIYFSPVGYNQIMRYNVLTEVSELVGNTYGTITNDFKWREGVKAGSILYFCNLNQTSILKFDLVSQTSSLLSLGGGSGFSSIEYYNNTLYLVPYDSLRVYQFDLLKKRGRFVGSNLNLASSRYSGSVRVGTNIYCAPVDYNQILNIKI